MKKQTEYLANDGYIRPKTANDLMKLAQSTMQTVYIYGSTGIGKTSLVTDYLKAKAMHTEYYTMSDTEALKTIPENFNEISAVAIDDLHLAKSTEERERLYAVLERLAANRSVWLILLSRAPVPMWLKPLCVKRIFMAINEDALMLSEKEEEDYLLNKWNLSLTPKTAEYLRRLTGGYPLALRVAAMRLRMIPKSCASTEERQSEELAAVRAAQKDLWDYLQTEVYDRWDIDLQEFLMDVSVVDSFDLAMAQQITRKSDAGRLILMAMETGNFLNERTENDHTVFELRRTLLRSMEKRRAEKYSQTYIDRLYYNVGSEYELREQIPKALEYYEKCGNEDSISRLLISNARKHAGSGHYWSLRKYYLELSDDVIMQSPELMAGMSLLQSIMMNDEESERWYTALSDYVKNHTGGEKKSAQARLFYLDISLPQRGTAKMTDILKNAWHFICDERTILPEMSLTNNQPTLMHGGKDFCEWSRRDRELARTIGRPVELLLGSFGKGLVSIALAESFFEKGEDDYEVQRLAQKGWMQALSGGRTEMAFVAVGITAWQAVLNNRMNDAAESLRGFKSTAAKDAPQILLGVDTLNTHFLLYTGRISEAAEWMKTAPDENSGFCTLERYRYITKARVYLAAGEKEKALSLLERLIFYAQKRQRTYLEIEALILLAIAQFRLGDKAWSENLQYAVSKAEDYHFVRILSRESAPLMNLFKAQDFEWKDDAFRKQVMTELKRTAQFYPAYLSEKQTGRVLLSDKALTVLRLQAEGKSVEQISAELYISKSGVKYYIQDTYKKLGVNNKAAAINEARNRKIL